MAPLIGAARATATALAATYLAVDVAWGLMLNTWFSFGGW
jgi:hypothetical protein